MIQFMCNRLQTAMPWINAVNCRLVGWVHQASKSLWWTVKTDLSTSEEAHTGWLVEFIRQVSHYDGLSRLTYQPVKKLILRVVCISSRGGRWRWILNISDNTLRHSATTSATVAQKLCITLYPAWRDRSPDTIKFSDISNHLDTIYWRLCMSMIHHCAAILSKRWTFIIWRFQRNYYKCQHDRKMNNLSHVSTLMHNTDIAMSVRLSVTFRD